MGPPLIDKKHFDFEIDTNSNENAENRNLRKHAQTLSNTMDLKFLELDHNDSEQFHLTRHNSQLLLHENEKNHVVEVEATQITDQENKNDSFRFTPNHGVFTNSTASAD